MYIHVAREMFYVCYDGWDRIDVWVELNRRRYCVRDGGRLTAGVHVVS